MLHDVTVYSVCATVFECDVSKANGERQWSFGRRLRKQCGMTWVGRARSSWQRKASQEKEHVSRSEIDRTAQAENCRDEDEANKAKIEVKSGVENCFRMETSWCCSSVDDRF